MFRLLTKYIHILAIIFIINFDVLERVSGWQLLRPTIIKMLIVPANLPNLRSAG